MKNKGYSFIEMMIVLAIMAVLTASAFLTIGIINNAKRDSGITTFESQLDSLLVKTKAMSKKEANLCMVMEKSDNQWCFYFGTIDETGNYVAKTDSSGNPEKAATLPANLDISYAGTNTHAIASASRIVVMYRKADGTVLYGSGDYVFSFRDKEVARVTLDADTGNHYRKEASK